MNTKKPDRDWPGLLCVVGFVAAPMLLALAQVDLRWCSVPLPLSILRNPEDLGEEVHPRVWSWGSSGVWLRDTEQKQGTWTPVANSALVCSWRLLVNVVAVAVFLDLPGDRER